jgi:Carboxypeptidase regulatory-like domain
MLRKTNIGLLAELLSVVLLLSVCFGNVKAQVLYGSLTGNVTDSSGAAIRGGTIKALNTGTGLATQEKADDRGVYVIGNLQPGMYDVTISAPSFGTVVRNGVLVEANVVVRLNTSLSVAGTTQSVTVSAAPPVLQTDRADVQMNLSTEEVSNLPLNSSEGRNFQILYMIVPGFSTPSEQNSAASNPQRAMTSFVNGSSLQSNLTLIDGATDLFPYLAANVAYVPPADSVESVNIVTNSFDAEEGMAGGAVINVSTKSGSNQFHGGAFWSTNNNDMRTLTYFHPANFRNPKNIFNEFGGTLGGPIRKNKVFFFGDYEGIRQVQLAFANSLIPPASLRPDANGNVNFSSTGTTIYNPYTGNSNGTGRTSFLNDTVPASLINPAALDYLKLLPQPNATGATYNFTNTADANFRRNDMDVKVNYIPTSKSALFVRYGYSGSGILDPPDLGMAGGDATNGGQPGLSSGRVQVVSIGGTYSFSSTVLLDGNVGYTRQRLNAYNTDLNTNYGLQFGIPGTNGPTYLEGGIPAFLVTGWSNLGDANAGNPFLFRDNQYVEAMNLSWQEKSHSLRFGVQRINWGINNFQPQGGSFQSARGGFAFSGGMTAASGGSAPNQNNAWADFLLGLDSTSGKAVQLNNPNTQREAEWAVYARDQWQATNKMTIVYGVRWEFYPFVRSDHGGVPVFDPSTGKVFIGGHGSVPLNEGVDVGHGQLLPRVGLTYRLNEKTVIRVGYGISADPSNYNGLTNAWPADILTNYSGVVTGSGSSLSPAGILSLPTGASGSTYTVGPYVVPVGIPSATIPDISGGVLVLPNNITTSTVPLHYERGHIQGWNLTAQRELGAGFNLQAAYVGSLGSGLQTGVNINAAPPGGGIAGQILNAQFGTSLFGSQTTWGSIASDMPWAKSNYNALQMQLQNKLGSGGFFGVSYTYSKAMNWANSTSSSVATPFFNYPAYWPRDYAASSFDQTNNLEIYGSEPLPFGKGKRWLTHGVGAQILGGWRATGVLTSVSGVPFTVTGSATSLNAPGNSQTANQVLPTVEKYGHVGYGTGAACSSTACRYFNTAAFSPVTTAAFGTAGRDGLRGPGFFNLNTSVTRIFTLYKEVNLQFQAEAFGLTNSPHFANPNSNVSTPSTFGVITSTLASSGSGASAGSDGSRQIWLGLRIIF